MSSTSKFLLGGIVGGAIGCVVGMLLAPRSGVETREMIRGDVEGKYQDSVKTITEKTDEVRQKAQTVVDDVSNTVKTITDELEDVGQQTVDKVTQSLEAKT